MRDKEINGTIKALFPWVACATALIVELGVAIFVFQHNEIISAFWGPYLDFAFLGAFILTVDFFLLRKKSK